MTDAEKIERLAAKVDELLTQNIDLQNDILFALRICETDRTGNKALALIKGRLAK